MQVRTIKTKSSTCEQLELHNQLTEGVVRLDPCFFLLMLRAAMAQIMNI